MIKYALAAFVAISAMFGLSANAAPATQSVAGVVASVSTDIVKVQHWRYGSRRYGHYRYGSRYNRYRHSRYGSRYRRSGHYRYGSRRY